MADDPTVVTVLLGLISSLVACLQLNYTLINNHFHYCKRRLEILKLLSISDENKRRGKHLKRTRRQPRPRRFWIRPGRTSAWWDNFVDQTVIEEEWRENFRMSRGSLYKLGDNLRQ